jgi:hypothetical protein
MLPAGVSVEGETSRTISIAEVARGQRYTHKGANSKHQDRGLNSMDEVVLARGCLSERSYDAIRVSWVVLGS